MGVKRVHAVIAGMILCSCVPALGLRAQSVAVSTTPERTLPSIRVTLQVEQLPLEKVLRMIAQQTGLRLYLPDDRLPPAKLVTVHLREVPANEALAQVLAGTGLRATFGTEKVLVAPLRGPSASPAQGTIAGKVIDAKTKQPIRGAKVGIQGGERGVETGEDGTYQLPGIAAGLHTIAVRRVGYVKQVRSMTVDDGAITTLDFTLEPSANVLDQVVITGTVIPSELKTVPNAITVITAKDIEQRGISHIDQLFRGDIPGLIALNTGTTSPDGGPSLGEVVMFSRGTTKIPTSQFANASTLTNPIKTYVDGVELADPKYLSQIDPKSIDRIEILTGPQASTIYGANAINGVMQIFTKRGTPAGPSITLGLVEGVAQNNLSSALASSHQYDGSLSGMEGRLSYNMGAGWDYTSAWTPSAQLQRVSVYGGTHYQRGPLTLDATARQGWTQNNVRGATTGIATTMYQNGQVLYGGAGGGLIAPLKRSLSGQTLGSTVGYTPFPSWSHQLMIGSDASNVQSVGTAPQYSANYDTTYTSSQTPHTRMSQSYSSTLRIALGRSTQATLIYGADHWRERTSTVSWSMTPSTGTLINPSVSRSKPSKNSGAYVQGQVGLLDAVFFTYGVRADWNPNYGAQAQVRPGRYGVSYVQEFGVLSAKLRGSYGRSIRPPDPGLIQGSPETDPNAIAYYGGQGSMLYNNLPAPQLGPEFQQGGKGDSNSILEPAARSWSRATTKRLTG